MPEDGRTRLQRKVLNLLVQQRTQYQHEDLLQRVAVNDEQPPTAGRNQLETRELYFQIADSIQHKIA